MGKEFIEYQREDGKIPYGAPTLCFCLTQYAKDYIKEKDKSNIINVDVRDAVIVDAINYLGVQGWCDFALYTQDLYDDKKHEKEVDGQCLLTVLINHFAWYINSGISESVLRNNHMNNVEEKFDDLNGALVIVDFINYIAKRNEFDRTFSIGELNGRYATFAYKKDLSQLKEFLEGTNKYNEALLIGLNMHDIFCELAEEEGLAHISRRGKYYNENGQTMHIWDTELIDKELYVMGYAFTKLKAEDAISGKIEDKIVRDKVREMKRR
jgi:hypothetical protein